ncbi:MAG: hypothetical protein ACI867_000935, partial [Glaciecola sp.]
VAVGLASMSFGGNAVSYLVVIGVLLTIPREVVEDSGRPAMWRSTALGLRYVRFTRPLRVLILVTALFVVTGTSLQALLPSVAADDLGLGAAGFGLLYGAFGIGALLGALSREPARLRLGRSMLPGSTLIFGVGGVAFGLSPTPGTSAIALFVAGVAWVWVMTTLNASVQLLAPKWVRGRVMSLYILAVGLQPIGAIVGGLLAESIGAGHAVALMTSATALLGLAVFRVKLPVLGEISEPTVPENWVVPAHADAVVGTPIVVATTWTIASGELPAFLLAMEDLRRVRLRTGAHRWEMLADADEPARITEHFTLHTWEEHLAQHARIDSEAATIIAAARSFDVTGGPITRHLAGMGRPSDAMIPRKLLDASALDQHQALHRQDGSIPISG